MIFCKVCDAEVEAEEDFAAGCSYCTKCGSVLEEAHYVNAMSFSAEGGLVGQMVTEGSSAFRSAVETDGNALYENQDRGRAEIMLIVDQLNIRPRDDTVEAALRLYKLAVHRGFLRGRRANTVGASCVYIICRQDRRPYLLIDFSDTLRVNIYTLGTVFLDLCLLFRLDHHPIITCPVDPSLFIHRYADRLRFGAKSPQIVKSALAFIKSMKRDWIQTGRRPSGLCGAALLLASQIHGCPRNKKDIVHVVHIGADTVSKRLVEFSQTKCGKLTAKQFEEQALEFDKDEAALLAAGVEREEERQLEPSGDIAEGSEKPDGEKEDAPGVLENRCHHIVHAGAKHHRQGMCETCYGDYVRLSGGIISGSSDPPAYTKNLRKEEKELARKKKLFLRESVQNDSDSEEDPDAHPIDDVEKEMERALKRLDGEEVQEEEEEEERQEVETEKEGPELGQEEEKEVEQSPRKKARTEPIGGSPVSCEKFLGPMTPEENEAMRFMGSLQNEEEDEEEEDKEDGDEEVEMDTLSDIDDGEINSYIRTSEEAKQKEVWWDEMFREHLLKEAVKKQQEALVEKVPPKKTKRKRKNAEKGGGEKGVSSPLEAVKGALAEQGLTKKINYNRLEKLFDFEKKEGVDDEERKAKEKEEAEEQRRALEEEREKQRKSEFLRALSYRRNDPAFQDRSGRLPGLYS
ncbi:hypothetical protein BSKO_06020 [Bryopsis sp. KO-2023]|nr:hypothetical protein BSKO_06020 [Bryopsis sp. KO-2023]